MDTDQTAENADQDAEQVTDPSPLDVLTARVAQLETASRAQIAELTKAVGRAQSLASKLETTGDTKVRADLNSQMATVADLIGSVTDGIDPSLLGPDVKRRVAEVRDRTRQAAEQVELAKRVEAEVAARMPQPAAAAPPDYTQQLSDAMEAEIRQYGQDPDDPAFDWARASTILRAEGADAMIKYFRTQISALVTGKVEPRRRVRTSPAAAGAVTTKNEMESFMDSKTDMAAKIKALREQGIPV